MTFVYVSAQAPAARQCGHKVKGRTEDAAARSVRVCVHGPPARCAQCTATVSKTRWTRIAYAVFGRFLPLCGDRAPGRSSILRSWAANDPRRASGCPSGVLENRDLRGARGSRSETWLIGESSESFQQKRTYATGIESQEAAIITQAILVTVEPGALAKLL